jgi:HEAT repeat protein
MKHFFLTLLLMACGCLFCTTNLCAHGGTYKGPGDVVPPGGVTPAPPAPPSPVGPSTPTGPTKGPASAPPTTPHPLPPLPPSSPQPRNPVGTTPKGSVPVDLSSWVFWWEFNKDRFLNLKARVHDAGNITEVGGLIGLGSGARAVLSNAPTQAQRQDIIIPALLALIHAEPDRDVQSSVLIALAKVGLEASQARPLLAQYLQSPIQEIAETAALAYGILGDEFSLPLLQEILSDSKAAQQLFGRTEIPLRSRTFAAYSLGLIGKASSEERIKAQVAGILFETLMSDQNAAKDIRVACVISLGILNLEDPTEIVNKLGAFLDADQESELVLAHVPNAMAKLLRNVPGGDATREARIDQLLKILQDRPKQNILIRQSAVQAIGMLATAKDPRNLEIFRMLQSLSDHGRNQQEKNFTAIALADLGTADPRLRLDVTKFLMERMKKSSTLYEPWCGLALGVMAFQLNDRDQSLPPVVRDATLIAFQRCKDPERKAAFALALGLMGHEAAASDLRAAMSKVKDSQFRGYAAVALGLLSSRQDSAFISDLVAQSQRDPDLLKQASIGLGLMKDRNANTLLLSYLCPENGKRPRLAVLAAVASALGFIGDKNSVAPLVQTMENERLTALGRAFAAVSLGMVADQNDLPWNSAFAENINYRAAVSTLTDQQTGTGILDIL